MDMLKKKGQMFCTFSLFSRYLAHFKSNLSMWIIILKENQISMLWAQIYSNWVVGFWSNQDRAETDHGLIGVVLTW